MSKKTQGTWIPGKIIGTVVSSVDSSDAYSEETRDYYGGMLIAESVANESDVQYISDINKIFKNMKLLFMCYQHGMKITQQQIIEIDSLVKKHEN